MRRSLVVCIVLLLMAIKAVASDTITASDTTRLTSTRTYNDPIDYNAVRYQLMRASRKSFVQRVFESLTQPIINDERIKLDASVGVGYTQETNLAFVLSATAAYQPKSHTESSAATLAAMTSINGFFRIQAKGVHNFKSARSRILYDIGGGYMPTDFWGLGYQAADVNARAKYRERMAKASLGYMYNIYRNLWLGGEIDAQYSKVADADSLATIYLDAARTNLRRAYTTGVALRIDYDTRDNAYTTTRGLYISLYGQVRPRFMGDYSHDIWHLSFEADYFQPLWRGGIMAIDIYGDFWSKQTPWIYWPSVGGQNRMRGYYYGRYRDRNMITAQLELRQNIYGPIGVCGWVGAGNVFGNDYNWSRTLPNIGLGARLALDGRTVLRIDYGWGKHSNGLIINVNEAF